VMPFSSMMRAMLSCSTQPNQVLQQAMMPLSSARTRTHVLCHQNGCTAIYNDSAHHSAHDQVSGCHIYCIHCMSNSLVPPPKQPPPNHAVLHLLCFFA
jgi:hypothetical protein